MSKEKDKLLLSAQKLAQRGQNDKAIKEYLKALELDKKDVKTLLKLGDLLAKVKKNEDSIKCYADAAKLYARDGFYSKAIAVYKRVLELDANRDDIYLLMADLYQRLGMVGDAMTQYQRISSNYEKDGKLKEALEIYRNMAELDPRNVMILTKLAELHYKNNNKPEGYTVFKRALGELKDQNRFEEYTRLMEKLAKADPDNVENLKELTTVYIKRKVYDRAYPFMVKICQVAPDDLQSLGNLAELCIRLERKDEAIVNFKELAKAYQKKGLRQKAQEALSRISFLEGKGGAVAPVSTPLEKAAKEEEVVELAEEFAEVKEQEVESGIEELSEAVEEEAVIETPEAEAAPEPEGLTPEQIQENITEADVYFKYGLRDKAMGHIQLVLKADPKNIEALKRMKNIMMDARNQDAALDTLRKIALYSDKSGDWKSLVEAAAEILKLAANDAPAQAWLKKADAELTKAPAAPPAKEAAAAEAKAEEPEVIEEEVVVEEEEEEEKPPVEAPPPPPPKVEAKPAPPPPQAKAAPPPKAPAPAPTPPPVAAPAPAPKTAPPPVEEVKPAPPVKAPAQPPPAPKAQPPVEEEVVITGKPGVAEKDFKEEVEEAEFYAQQGLEEESLRVYLEILQKEPANKNAIRRVKELENILATKAPKAAAAPPKKEAPIEIEVEEHGTEAPDQAPAPAAQARPASKAAPITIEEEEEITAGEVIEEEEETAPAPEVAKTEPAPEPEPAPVPEAAKAQPEISIEEEVVTEEAMVGFEGPPPEPAAEQTAAAPQAEPAAPEAPPVQEAPAPAPEPEPVPVAEEPTPPPEEAPASVSAEAPAPSEQVPEEPAFAATEESPPASEAPATPAVSAEAPAPAEALGDAAGGDMFDLAAELEKEDIGAMPSEIGSLNTSEKYGFEDMFKSFKEGVSKVVSETDSSTHYDLGIAYKEMGLCDDAIREFQTALKAGHNPADCYIMVGLCHCERGKFEQAIAEYEKGTADPKIPEKDKAGLLYESGQAWLSLGDLEKSRQNFEKCRAIDPGLRDVGARIEELNSRLSGQKPEIPPTPSREDKSWESAALEQKPAAKTEEEEDAAKKKSRKKISYV